MTLLDQIAGAEVKVLRPSGGCHKCPLRLRDAPGVARDAAGRIDFVPATLRAGPVLWLGEAPGATEVVEQEGFVGDTGKLLRREAELAKVPGPWSFSNAVHCRPPDNDEPTPRAVECCLSQFVLDEARGYPFVVLVGSVPLQAFFPGAKGSHCRGNVMHHPDFPGQRFYQIYHPSFIARRPDMKERFRQQLERLARVARGDTAGDVELVTGPTAFNALREALAAPVVSLDLETTGAESWRPETRIVSLGVSADGRRVAAAHEEDPWFVAALEAVRAFLEDPAKGVIGSHVAFDVEMLERELDFRARCQGVHDVGVIWYEAAQHLYPSLKQLVSERLDGYRWLVHEPHRTRDVGLLLRYMAEDVAYAHRLFVKGMTELRPRTRDLVARVIGPMTLVYKRAQTHGLYVRQDYRRAKLAEYEERRREAVSAWKAEDPEFIPDEYESGKGLARYLFEVRGLPALARTKEGQPVVDKSAIKQWIRDGAVYLRHLLIIREIDKIAGTYLKGFDKHLGPDSRVHPTHWLTSTVTSRPSSTDPNVYNMPRGAEIRDMIGAPPGAVLVESDLSQIELRIMFCLAKDETGIAAYLRGEDAHTATARAITGDPTPTKAQRSDAKPVNFGCVYGASAFTLKTYAADEYGVIWTDEEAQRFLDTFMGTYKRIPEMHEDRRRRLIENRGWFESVTGHVWHYENWDHADQKLRDHAFRQAINAEAQGPAANICYYIAVLARQLLDERGFRDVLCVNSVYDSIMTEVPNPAWVEPVVLALEDAVRQAYEWVRPWFVVPLVMDHAVGESWGSLVDWKKWLRQ